MIWAACLQLSAWHQERGGPRAPHTAMGAAWAWTPGARLTRATPWWPWDPALRSSLGLEALLPPTYITSLGAHPGRAPLLPAEGTAHAQPRLTLGVCRFRPLLLSASAPQWAQQGAALLLGPPHHLPRAWLDKKTTGLSTKSFSSRSRFITLGFKRRKLAWANNFGARPSVSTSSQAGPRVDPVSMWNL